MTQPLTHVSVTDSSGYHLAPVLTVDYSFITPHVRIRMWRNSLSPDYFGVSITRPQMRALADALYAMADRMDIAEEWTTRAIEHIKQMDEERNAQ